MCIFHGVGILFLHGSFCWGVWRCLRFMDVRRQVSRLSCFYTLLFIATVRRLELAKMFLLLHFTLTKTITPMKNITFLAITLLLVACGSKQQVAQQYPNYGGYYPQQQYAPQQQQGLLDPTTMQSNVSPCERLANQGWHQGKIRGYGSAESGNRDMARNRATMSARNQIAGTLNALVQSYMRDYNEDIQQDDVASNSQMFLATQEQVVKEMVSGTAIIFSDVKQNGNRYFYEVCVELDKNAVEEAILSQSAKNGIKMDAAKFREAAQNAWDRYSIEKAGYNPAAADFENMQQQQRLNMQQQQINMQQQFQQNQQQQ